MADSKVTPPASTRIFGAEDEGYLCLELEDGSAFQGYSFGAPKTVAGELVFQTGMVGYTESLTDPSYRGLILVLTFPEAGNYGVPTREAFDELVGGLPAYIESSRIHVAGLVTSSYSGEDYSHFLAESSLGTWLKKEGVPAMYGVDTRALTKRIRNKGALLSRMRFQKQNLANGVANGQSPPLTLGDFQEIEWTKPDVHNIVAQGRPILSSGLLLS
jgi:carbamoyl-phosphate synthase/aspartate carbamoyltransferase